MMLIPVDAYSTKGQPFVSSVERDVLAYAIFVLCDECSRAAKRSLFFDGEDEYQICFRSYVCFVKRANRSKQRLYVARIVSVSRSINLSVAYLGFDLQSFLKYRIEVRVEDHCFGSARSFAYRYEVAF